MVLNQIQNLIKQNIFDQIAIDIAKFEYDFDSPLFIVAGDLNGRTGSDVADYIECDSANYLPLYDDYIEDIPSSYSTQCEPCIDTCIDTDDAMSSSIRSSSISSLPPRISMDKVVNEQGKCILEMCKMCNLCIVNGRIYPDKPQGRFSCFTYNGASTTNSSY